MELQHRSILSHVPPRSAPVAPRRDVPLLRHRRHRLRALLSEPVSNVTGKTGPPREEEQEVREGRGGWEGGEGNGFARSFSDFPVRKRFKRSGGKFKRRFVGALFMQRGSTRMKKLSMRQQERERGFRQLMLHALLCAPPRRFSPSESD